MQRAALILLPVLVIACGGEDGIDPPPPPPPPGELAIGSADSSGVGFVAVADGAQVELISGAQGGFHVWTGIQITGVAGDLYMFREARRVSDGALVLASTRQYVDVPQAAMDGWWTRPDAAASFMCPAPVGIRIYGEELAFSVELRDEDDNVVADDHIILVPTCPTGDKQALCESICDG